MPEGVHIWPNNWLLCVYCNIGLRSDHQFDLGLEVQGQICLKYICLMDHKTKIVSKYDQEIPQSQTPDNPVAPPGRAA